jgi:hypothetical protein
MSITERLVDPLPAWPSAAELAGLEEEGHLILLPDRLDDTKEGTLASFRDEAQVFRVAARQQGLRVTMLMPEGAKPAVYREHAADWILAAIVAVPGSTIAMLIGNEIQRRLDKWRGDGSGETPTLTYREAVRTGDEVRMPELIGPADEVANLLRGGGSPPLELNRTSDAELADSRAQEHDADRDD